MLSDAQKQEIEVYGRLLTGAETELELAKFARIKYLKNKMRPRLAALIGDTPDNVTDVLRAFVLGEAIRLGLVTDPDIIQEHTQYIEAMLSGYGGAESIIWVLRANMGALQRELVDGYYQAKMAVLTSWSLEEIRGIDLPGEPVSGGQQVT